MSEMTLDEAFALAAQLHQQGRLQEAEMGYRHILTHAANHVDALNLLGVVISQLGRPAEGAEFIRQATVLEPTSAHYKTNLAVALAQIGRRDEAILALREAALFQSDVPETHFNLANLLRDEGKLQEAVSSYEQALMLRPDYSQALNNLGLVLIQLGRLPEAIDAYRKAVSAQPTHVLAWINLGNALSDQGEVDEAIDAYKQATALKPDSDLAFTKLGQALERQNRFDEAVEAFRRAAMLKPQSSEASGALGNALHRAGRFDEAEATFRDAAALHRDLPQMHYSLGNVLKDKGKLDEAIAEFDRAIKRQPDYADAAWNRGLSYLLKGDFERGWPAYEARWKREQEKADQPLWDGSHLLGQRILLRLEQGLGDIIQFIRYAPLVAERGGKVIVQCPPEISRLLEGQCRINQVVTTDDPSPRADVWFPLLSLTGLMHTTLETIPNDVPYLLADAAAVDAWETKLREVSAGRKIGLAWAGSPKHADERRLSIPLPSFAPLGKTPGIQLFSLQKGEAAQLAGVSRDWPIIDMTADLVDLAATAALIANLDLVIACDTAVAHLAGAMAKAVWLLLPFAPDWRWMLEREDSPWYPTMRLFRQPRPGDWDSPIQRIVNALANG